VPLAAFDHVAWPRGRRDPTKPHIVCGSQQEEEETIMTNPISDVNPILQLLSDEQYRVLLANGQATMRHGWFGSPDVDREPVALLRCSCGDFYLLSEIDPTEPNIAYCLYEDSECVPMLDTVDFDAVFDSSEGIDDHAFEVVLGFVATDTIGDYYRRAKKSGSVRALFGHVS
jgi:hypothetical protein